MPHNRERGETTQGNGNGRQGRERRETKHSFFEREGKAGQEGKPQTGPHPPGLHGYLVNSDIIQKYFLYVLKIEKQIIIFMLFILRRFWA